jgi:hypothetical protein
MSAVGIAMTDSFENKKVVCKSCIKKRNKLKNHFSFINIGIEDFIVHSDDAEIRQLLNTVNKQNWKDFCYVGIPVGRFASYEYLLNEKINSIEFEDRQWAGYLTHLDNALKTLFVGLRIFESIKPDRLITYNSLYSVNHIMCAVAEKYGVSHYTLHAGSHHVFRLSEMTIFKGLVPPFLINRSETWVKYSKIPLLLKSINRVERHVNELLRATSPWVYTKKSQGLEADFLRNTFGINKSQRVLLLTMASADERFAASLVEGLPPYEEPIFPNQINWIENVVDWVRARPDIFVLIRVHPREFPNKREKVLSLQARKLRGYFDDLPKNVLVNWPEDEISLHDIFKITDVGLNATSTSGLEMLLFGIPVVIYDRAQLFAYPSELNYCGESQGDYFEKIELALSGSCSITHAIRAYRWLSYKSEVVGIDISDGYISPSDDSISRLIRKFYRVLGFSNCLPGLKINRPIPLGNTDLLANAIEENIESHIVNFDLSQHPGDESAQRVELEHVLTNTIKLWTGIEKHGDVKGIVEKLKTVNEN